MQDTIKAMARSDCAFDGRDWYSLGRADKRRYLQRSFRGLTAAARTVANMDDLISKMAMAKITGEEEVVNSILEGRQL